MMPRDGTKASVAVCESGAFFGTPMFDVWSSNVGRIGYEEATKRLYVQFRDQRANTRDGAIYAYHDVPQCVYDELMAQGDRADGSVGREFHRLVKSVGYEYRRIA